jgi:hypothetical protein
MKAFTKEGLLEYLKEKLADLNDNDAKALELYNMIVSKVK